MVPTRWFGPVGPPKPMTHADHGYYARFGVARSKGDELSSEARTGTECWSRCATLVSFPASGKNQGAVRGSFMPELADPAPMT